MFVNLRHYSRHRARKHRLRLESLEERTTPTIATLTSVADNTLYEHASGQLSNGAGQHVYVGKTGAMAGNKIRRALVEFDLSSIPAGSTINSAQLTMHVSRPNNGVQSVDVHRVLTAWGEADSNAGPGAEGDGTTPHTSDATWIHTFFDTQTWTTPGGDFAEAISASKSIDGIGNYDWTGAGLTADVQQWFVNSATNHGWVLLGNEAASMTAKELSSREDVTPANWPTLTIDYTPPADLVIDKSHAGDFTQGDANETYTILVSNIGAGPTTTTVTISDLLPAGLTPTAANNGVINGWNVSTIGQTVTATRNNLLAAGNSYPALPIIVSVAADAPAGVVNTATVAGGGETNTANNSDDDPTTIIPVADLTVDKSHAGDFTQGQSNAVYAIIVNNIGLGSTSGVVTITDVLPAGLTPTPANNGLQFGWDVSTSFQTVTATRSDALASGFSYPILSVLVNVAGNAPGFVVNSAAVAGGGEVITGNDSDDDPTTIQPYNNPNQPPVNSLPTAYSTAEDTAVVLAGIAVEDVDSFGGSEQVTFVVASGKLTVNAAVAGGMTPGQVSGNGTGTVVVTAPLAAINATLAHATGLTFAPSDNANGSFTLTMTTDDLGLSGTGGPQSDTDNASIAVSAVNDAPVNTLPAAGATDADTPLALTGIAIGDVDIGSASASVVLNVTNGTLAIDTSIPGCVTATDVVGNGSGLVTVLGTLAAVNTTLAGANGLVFSPAAAFSGTATLTLVANDLGNSGSGGAKADTDTQAITVTRVLDHFTIDAPASTAAGAPVAVTVTARNSAGGVIANYGGTIDLVSSDPQATLPASATFSAGIASFNATLRTAGNQSIAATDRAVPSIKVQDTVAVSPANATQIVFAQQPTGTLVNAPFLPAIQVVAVDAFGNLATNNSSDVVRIRLQSNPAGATLAGLANVTLVNGVATFPTLRLSKAGQGLTFAAASAALPVSVSDPFDVVAVARFGVTASPSTAVAGSNLQVTVRALDAKGNVVAGYAGKVHFTSSDVCAILPADGTLTNGEGTFAVTLKTTGAKTIAVADRAKATTRGALAKAITVTPAAVSGLRLDGLTSDVVAGQKLKVTVFAVDAFGNTNFNYRGTTTLSSDDPFAALPPAYTFTARDAGKHLFNIAFNSRGLLALSAGDGTFTTTRSNIVIGLTQATVLVQADPDDSTKTALVLIGTKGIDSLNVVPSNAAGSQLEVLLNGISQGTAFAPTGHVLVYGFGGNDTIGVLAGTGALTGVKVPNPIVIDGGAGNDVIDASDAAGNAIILGRDGNDSVTGGAGRDILIGGSGKDTQRGGAGDDILVAGPATPDTDLAGLLRLMDEWGDAGVDFITRVQHIGGTQPGGANGASFLNATTVRNDTSADQLFGGNDSDWFLFAGSGKMRDLVLDAVIGEVLSEQ